MGMNDHLEPCPFCGAKVDMLVYVNGGVIDHYAIHCNCCGMETMLCTKSVACSLQYWVMKAWNRRTWNEAHNRIVPDTKK